jgi:1-acyl-sn-glycerol-3-phosphate acyltransferase
MRGVLRGARSLASVLLVGLWFATGSLVLRLLVVPASWLLPSQRQWIVTVYMKMMSIGIRLLLTLGGARFRCVGRLPTASPILAVANHQSLTDILQVTVLARPRVPAFVTRKRYGRFVPLVSQSVRLLGSPLIDPRRDPRGSVEAIRHAARNARHGILIFAEGHRTTDGTIRPFRAAGIEAILGERRMPVYLVLNEGAWRVARLADLLFRVHLIDAVSEVMGPFEAPIDPAEIPAFVAGLRSRLVQRLAEIRGEQPPATTAA